jgi:pimeloyl-ACP methyl ester carboxylesterase
MLRCSEFLPCTSAVIMVIKREFMIEGVTKSVPRRSGVIISKSVTSHLVKFPRGHCDHFGATPPLTLPLRVRKGIAMGKSISSLVFQPPQVTYLQTKNHLIWLRTANDVDIPAFYIDRKSKITVLFSHGNAEDLGMFYDSFLEFSLELKVNVLAYDYEGYGKAGGVPSEQGCYHCIDAAFHFLNSTLHIPSEQIVLYGRSLGSGPSCYLAEKLHKQQKVLGGLMLQVSTSLVPVRLLKLSRHSITNSLLFSYV